MSVFDRCALLVTGIALGASCMYCYAYGDARVPEVRLASPGDPPVDRQGACPPPAAVPVMTADGLRSAPMAAPAWSVDGERLRRLTQDIRGPARCIANQLQTPEQRCIAWIEAKTKASADPAIFQVFDMQQRGATESELLDYAGKHVTDKLQAVVLNGWIRDQFHPRSDATVGASSLGRGGGAVLISKPTPMVPPHSRSSGPGL